MLVYGEKVKAVYPRVGGGNPNNRGNALLRQGLSPRGRGKPQAQVGGQAGTRSIPAWAGETPPPRPRRTSRGVYPRVGGGNLLNQERVRAIEGLSPRGRGKRPPG